MSESTLHIFLYICIGAVILGVVLEGYEHWEDLRTKGWRPVWPKLGFAILVLGLCGELALQPFFDSAENDFRAGAHRRIAEAGMAAADADARAAEAKSQAERARLQAAEANEKAEKERVERLKIEEKLAPRSLSVEEQVAVANALLPFAGQAIEIFVYEGITEIRNLGNQVYSILVNAKWEARPGWGTEIDRSISGILVEVSSDADDISLNAAKALVVGLSSVRLMVVGPESWVPVARGGHVATTGSPIRITIGNKP